jgi:uncharacterized protein YfaS (alpha-2-macroglobulin family)
MTSQGANMSAASRRVVVFIGWAIGLSLLLGFLPVTGLANGPAIVQRSPEPAEELAVDSPIVVVFDRAMNRTTVEAAFSLSPHADGRFEWPDERTVQYFAAAEWERGTEYRVLISTTATSQDGEPLAERYTFRFRTIGYLAVTQTLPVDGSAAVAVDSTIFVMFNRPVVPLTALSDPSYAALPVPLLVVPAIAGTGEWLNTAVYVFTPSEPMRGGTTYTATVPAGLTDTTGGIVPEDVSWQFTTERPRVVWTSPASGEDLVPIDSEIRVTFNMPISLEGARDRFRMRTNGALGKLFAEDVAGELTTDANTLIFTPSEPLAFDRSYVVSIAAGVTGADGGLGTEESVDWRFRTVPLPRILGTSPEDGETGVDPYTAFLIHFNAPVDPDSVLANLTVDPAPDPDDLYGYFRAWDNTYLLRFGPEPSRDYTIRIGPNIADPYGNVTGQPMTVRFSTGPLDPATWLHVPGWVGTFSTYEPTRLFVAHRNLDTVTLILTKVSIDEYFDALDDWYDYSPPREGRIRRWSVDVSSPLNEVGYTPVDLLPDGGSIEPGIYVVELSARGIEWNRWQHRHIFVASPVNLTLKTAEEETLVWATDLSTGSPIPGLILRAYDADGKSVDASITDRDGLATFPGSAAVDWRGLTFASNVPFSMGSSQWDDGISVWEFGFSSSDHRQWRLFLDTDRPIYRPDQSVHFKGILRAEDDASYSLPPNASVNVVIRDAAWDLIYETILPIDGFGTFSGDLELDEGATLGTYRIEVSFAGYTFSDTFSVAAYRPPEFQITVTPERDEVAFGEAVDVAIGLEYFFGGPVADVPVEWRVFSAGYRFSPPQLGRYTFTDDDDPWGCWSCWWRAPESPTPILEDSNRSNRNGMLLVELPEDVGALHLEDADAWPGSRTLTVEATAIGNDGQTLSGRETLVVHAGDFYVGLATPRSIGRAGDPLEVEVITVDWLGERIADRSLTYTAYRREWSNVFEEDEAGGGRWTWTTIDTEVASASLATDGQGDAQFSFVPPVGGTYKVVISGVDASERTVRSSLFVWVSGAETVSWRRSNDDRITLISDKVEYGVGETAEILIPSPYPGEQWALITVERGGILSREVVRLESNSSVHRLPISEDYVPNVYVGVVLVRGREAALAALDGSSPVAETKVGYVELAVSRAPKILHIDLTPSDPLPQPGGSITFDVRVTDDAGLPVRGSLAFDLVDKAVLTLLPRTPNAILDAFYGRRGLGVGTASGLTISINRLVAEQLEEIEEVSLAKYGADDATTGAIAPMAAPGEALEEAGAAKRDSDASSQLPAGLELREDFQDTAYWNAHVTTDENGWAQVLIELPDNLTTWVARGVGVTLDTRVGETTGDLLVTKPLLIRPVTPRFVVVGDRVRLAANVSNQTTENRSVDVTLGHTGLELESGATQSVVVPSGGEATVVWWATVLDVSSVDLAFSAVSGELSDAARPRLTTGPDGTLLVYRYTAPETVGTAGQLSDAGSRTEIVTLPPNVDRERSELRVRLETSLAAAMQQSLSHLEHFEYECTEQVVSRFLPNILTFRAIERLGIESPELEERLPALVAEGLDKLYVRQNGDGGWGWWTLDESSPYLTAYVAFALIHTRNAGYTVNEDVLDRGLGFLERSLVPVDDLTSYVTANRQAWILFVLAEAGWEPTAAKFAADLFDERAKLSHYARAFLAMTLDDLGSPAGWIDVLLSDLYNDAIISATGVHWEESDYDWWAMNTDTRSTAVILAALVRLDPTQPLLPNVVRWLMVARKDGIWETTQETAWALISLTDWMEATGELEGSYEYGAALNADDLYAGTASSETHLDPTLITVPAEGLDPNTRNRLRISRGEGPGTLYYSAHLSVRLPVEDVEPLHRGIVVQRQYVPADCPFDENCPELAEVGVGETVQVRLTIIAPHDLYYVVVEDPFPAGCEAVDTSLATTSLTDLEPGLYRQSETGGWPWFYRWWWRWYTRSELRDEKLALFADYLAAGTYTYQYTLRATVPGEYHVLPTSAYEFYFPEVFGRSDGRVFVVEEGE